LGLFCWEDACQQHTAQNVMGSKWMKEEQGLIIRQNKIMDAAGIEPMTSR
jgi:hypothetical protein